jgi:hypothetical protein
VTFTLKLLLTELGENSKNKNYKKDTTEFRSQNEKKNKFSV